MFLVLLRLLLIVVLVRALWRLVGGIIEGSAGGGPPRSSAERPSVPLERDPVCGTFVVRTRAMTITGPDGVKYFCSERCRRTWTERRAAG